jgi:hypothetical protein
VTFGGAWCFEYGWGAAVRLAPMVVAKSNEHLVPLAAQTRAWSPATALEASKAHPYSGWCDWQSEADR